MFRGRQLLTNINLSLNIIYKSPPLSSHSQQYQWTSCLVVRHQNCFGHFAQSQRAASTLAPLTPEKVTEILATNEFYLGTSRLLPAFIKSIECNQLASNSPIEDRIRISSIQYPGLEEPTLFLGVFDGHGGGTTADIICRRLFNYIAIALHPDPSKLEISNRLSGTLIDLHNSPKLNNDPRLQTMETEMLNIYRDELLTMPDVRLHGGQNVTSSGVGPSAPMNKIASKLKASFQRCDDDLSQEIQGHLEKRSSISKQAIAHYMNATVSGCCAIVMVLHQGFAYLASTGDCRAVMGIFDAKERPIDETNEQDLETKLTGHPIHPSNCSFKTVELNEEHNCDNINEVRRLAMSHPKSEQNTMIRHNRLLGHLMPFRAFGDFQYKWTAEIIKACGLTQRFNYYQIIPDHYETPPYLITEPDVTMFNIDQVGVETTEVGKRTSGSEESSERYLVMATDGLWEMFESSRDVIETLVDHTINAYREGNEEDYDENSATYLLRSALRCGPHQDIGMDRERLRRLYHNRLQSTLSLPKAVSRNYRDDISIILMKL